MLAGPVIGARAFQDFLNLIGAETPEVAAYRNFSFELTSSKLKATQGARPSDFDLRMFMSLIPSLTEIFSPSADARMEALEQSLSLQAFGKFNKEQRDQIQAIKGQAWSKEDQILQQEMISQEII